jgi:glycosyltransferase involved in cell wall biosynthesis
MELSIIMPYLDDLDVLQVTMPRLLEGMPKEGAELIIVDDGSFTDLYVQDPRVKIIRHQTTKGVGLSFNHGVEMAQSCNIVLMGCDVIPQKGWYKTVVQDLNGGPPTIYCSVSSEFSDEVEPFSSSRTSRYGANLLYTVTDEDLPDDRKKKDIHPYAKILQTKWNYDSAGGERFMDIQCLLGAFYWMKKEDFQKIHGFNGHQRWGSLEPMISIKARAHGMDLVLDKSLEAAHFYDREIHRPVRADYIYYNMLFIASTMFSDALRDDLLDFLLYDTAGTRRGRLNVNQAIKIIKRNYGLVQAERDYNNRHFKNGLIKNFDKF